MLSLIKRTMPRTVPVMTGYLFLGTAYGAVMRSRGLGAAWSGLCSLLIYGGSMQFAMIDSLTEAFAPLTVMALAFLIQARHLFYGLSMLRAYRDTGRAKPYLILSLTDETYSLVCGGAPEGEEPKKWYTAVSLLDQLYWITGSVLGGIIGGFLPTEALAGIDFAMTALFTVIVTEQSMDSLKRYRSGEIGRMELLYAPLLGGGATLLSLLAAGKESFLLLAMGGMLMLFYARWQGTAERRRWHE